MIYLISGHIISLSLCIMIKSLLCNWFNIESFQDTTLETMSLHHNGHFQTNIRNQTVELPVHSTIYQFLKYSPLSFQARTNLPAQ